MWRFLGVWERMVPQSKQLSPPHVLTEYSVLPQTDFFHLLCDKHIFKLAYNPYTIWGWCVTIWTVRFPSICAVGMNIQGNLSGSILCFSKGLHTAHCPSIVPIKNLLMPRTFLYYYITQHLDTTSVPRTFPPSCSL